MIEKYCKTAVAGWKRMPAIAPSMFSFIRNDGININASIKAIDGNAVLHASISPIRSLQPNMTPEEHEEYCLAQVRIVFPCFFGNREFTRMPNDPQHEHVKHYFSKIENYESEKDSWLKRN